MHTSLIGYQSEILRGWGEDPETITTHMLFKKIPRSQENIRLAEEELSRNKFGFEEDRIEESGKALIG